MGPQDRHSTMKSDIKEQNNENFELKKYENEKNNNNNNISYEKSPNKFEKDEIIVPELNNWIHQLTFGSYIGIVANIALAIYFWNYIFSFEKPFAAFDSIMGPKNLKILAAFLLIEHIIILTIFYPLSRISNSTQYNWSLGTFISTVITLISLFDLYAQYTTITNRIVISIEAIRMTMKIVAFLSECHKDEKKFQNTTLGTFVYFLFVPNFSYKIKYEKTKKIRLTRLIYFINWFCIILILFPILGCNYFVKWTQMDFSSGSSIEILKQSLRILVINVLSLYLVIHIGYFELWCGFFAEILRYPNRKLFGNPLDYSDGQRTIRELDIVVSKFFSDFVYKPIYSSSKSRFEALFWVYAISIFYHELVLSYGLNQLFLTNLFVIPLASIVGLARKTNSYVNILRIIVTLILTLQFFVTHSVEYYAWRSPVTGYENESKLRLIPLTVKYFLNVTETK